MHDPAGPYMYGPGQRRMRRCLSQIWMNRSVEEGRYVIDRRALGGALSLYRMAEVE